MARIEWNNDLKIHVNCIDVQHQRLVEIINELDDAIQAGHGHDSLGKILGELLDYTKGHFAFEEQLFEEHGYPDTPAHKAEHHALAEKVVFMTEMFQKGDPTVTTEQVMMFLEMWLRGHILDVDKAYVPFFQAKGIN